MPDTDIETIWGSKQIPLRFDRHPNDTPFGYEPEITNVIERFVEPGDFVIDAGASIGFHTCFASKLVGDTGLVLAFEPELESYELLLHNVQVANKLNNVACLRTALWNVDRPELKLCSIGHIGYSSIYPTVETSLSETVEGRSLDTLLVGRHRPFPQPRLMKIDCEGAELEILRGAHDTLSRGVDCVLVEFNYHVMQHLGRTDLMIREYMAALGYELFLINAGDGNGGYARPVKVDLDKTITLRGAHWINVMFSTEQKVQERWQ